jgi:hypothetical protein
VSDQVPESILFVTKVEFAELYNRSLSTIDRWISKGKLPQVEHGPLGHGWWLDKLKRHLRTTTKPVSGGTMRGSVKAKLYAEAEDEEQLPQPRPARARLDDPDD